MSPVIGAAPCRTRGTDLRRHTVPTVFVALVLTLLAVLPGGSAVATSPPPPPPAGGGSTGAGAGTSGSSGGSQTGTLQNCSLYANPNSFGLTCFSGGGSGVPGRTVGEILGKDPIDFCWDVPVDSTRLGAEYGIVPEPGSVYALHSCVTGLVADQPVADQPGEQLAQQVTQFGPDPQPCPRPYPADPKALADLTGTCLMALTANQQQIAGRLDDGSGDIPAVVLATYPSSHVRTNEAVAYSDVAAQGETRTPSKTIGPVSMYAQMTDFRMFPYGAGPAAGVSGDPAGAVDGTGIPCSGTTTPDPGAVPLSNDQVTSGTPCWWTYHRSSAAQPQGTYPLRLEATWTVYTELAGVSTPFATFHKFVDVPLPVDDVQTLVVP